MASRGLDIQGVDVDMNYDIPMNSKAFYPVYFSTCCRSSYIAFFIEKIGHLYFVTDLRSYAASNAGLCPSGW